MGRLGLINTVLLELSMGINPLLIVVSSSFCCTFVDCSLLAKMLRSLERLQKGDFGIMKMGIYVKRFRLTTSDLKSYFNVTLVFCIS